MAYWKLELKKLYYRTNGSISEKKTFLGNFRNQKELTNAIEKEIEEMRKSLKRKKLKISIIYCNNRSFPNRIRYVVSDFCVFDAHLFI